MKTLIFTTLLALSFSSSAAIYKMEDQELKCQRYMSQDSEYLDKKEAELADRKESEVLKRVSIKAALNFSKREGKFNLKGTFGFWPIVMDVTLGEFSERYLMDNVFKSICLSDKNEVIDAEYSRSGLNQWNDLDRLDADD